MAALTAAAWLEKNVERSKKSVPSSFWSTIIT
jgi:hypothetical protein